MNNTFHSNQNEKDFASWMRMKERIHQRERDILFHAQEVWWCSLGANVGVEADGKNTLFERPVVVFRKLNSEMFWALPLTSKRKEDRPYHFKLTLQNRPQVILLSQMRVLSTKRLIRRLTKLSDREFALLGECMYAYIQKTDPLRGPQVPNGNNESSIASQAETSIPAVKREKPQ